MVNRHSLEVVNKVIKCACNSDADQDIFYAEYWQVREKKRLFLNFRDEPEACGNPLLALLVSFLCVPFVLWTNSHGSGLSIVVSCHH